jgi:hypothetical protein
MKRICAIVAASALMVSTSFAANVAVVGDVSGKVLVNKGEGFLPVSGTLELNAGDRVMVGQDSFATLTYANCAVSLSSPSVVAVTEKPNCDVVTPTADFAPAAFPLPIILGAVVVGTVVTYIATDRFGTKKKNKPCSGGLSVC